MLRLQCVRRLMPLDPSSTPKHHPHEMEHLPAKPVNYTCVTRIRGRFEASSLRLACFYFYFTSTKIKLLLVSYLSSMSVFGPFSPRTCNSMRLGSMPSTLSILHRGMANVDVIRAMEWAIEVRRNHQRSHRFHRSSRRIAQHQSWCDM